MKNKLELNWINQSNDTDNIEPRILLENQSYSFGKSIQSKNMLIHGDNLLGLKALETDYHSKVKAIYIDPPFNTGNAFEHYDDGIEHSIWLDLMYRRFEIMKNLLTTDGFLMVHLDDEEMAYCKVLLDQVFGRKNYLNTITITTNEPSGFKATSSSIFSTANYILVYAKDKSKSNINKVYIEKDYDKAYSKVILNIEDHYSDWQFTTIKELISKEKGYETVNKAIKDLGKEKMNLLIKEFAIENSEIVFRTAAVGGGAKIKRKETINKSKEFRNKVFVHPNEDVKGFYILNGEQILFYKKRLELIDGELKPAQVITDVWTDISVTGIAKEGNVVFKNGKKPEKLIRRCLEMTTNKGDLVLDSFAGSGTTAAVAHKMGRNWITIEMGNQVYDHCYPRLKSIINGEDKTGVSILENWQGGGGFKFYELAPSLLNKDKYDNWVISKEYNPNMLAAAMAKQEGFTYSPDKNIYWKQGYSAEQDFIFTTTQFVTVELLDQLQDQLKDGESLLICAKKFQPECHNKFKNIVLKKIPKMLLGKCEFGKDDYSLNIINPQVLTEEDLGHEE